MSDAPKLHPSLNLPVSAFRDHPASRAARRRLVAVEDGRHLFENDGDAWSLDAGGEPTPRRGRRPDAEARAGWAFPLSGPRLEGCPLPSGWPSWDTGPHDYRALAPAERRACAVARRLFPLDHRGFLDPAWELAQWEMAQDEDRAESARSSEAGRPARARERTVPAHAHADVTLEGHRVHLDVVGASRGGPGRSYEECRIFVDGRLAGRGGHWGCSLGAGGSDLPAVAAVGLGRGGDGGPAL